MLYAKALFIEKHYITSFEILQNAFCKRPTFTIFLFELGKYEVLSDVKNFRGSAIGILQECLRSCVTHRKAEVNYYLGLVYKKLQQPLKAFEYFQTSYQQFKDKTYHPYGCPEDKKKVIKSFIEEYYDVNKFEYIIKRKAKAVQQAVKENKDVKITDTTLESLISACNALIRADKINGPILRAVIAWEIKLDKDEAISVYQRILEKYPGNMEAYFHYWEFLSKIGEKKKLIKVSEAMMKAVQSTSVPTSEWMRAHSLRSKTLLMLEMYEEAIEVLKRQVHIIPPLPIPGLSYFKNGEIVVSHSDEDLEDPFEVSEDAQGASEFHASPDDGYKFTVGRSSKPKPHKPEKQADSSSEKWNMRSVNPAKSYNSKESLRFSFNSRTPKVINRNFSRGESGTTSESSESWDTQYEIEGFSVSTDVDFLYQIGKICAENGIKIEEGIQSLNDFCLILDYYHQDMDEKVYTKMKTQAKFYIGVCYFRKKNIDATEIVLRGILDDLEEIEGTDGARYKETLKVLSRCFRERLLYEVQLFDDYFYPPDEDGENESGSMPEEGE